MPQHDFVGASFFTSCVEIYSPVHSISYPLIQKAGVSLFVKRDDLIHPFISGNKWRKLKYHVEDMRQKKKNTIVTFGGAYSNHLLATAVAGASLGFKTIGIVRGEDVQNTTLFLCRLHGMELRFLDRESYRHKEQYFQQKYASELNTYFVDEGGAGALGSKGCVEIIDELTTSYHHIFCAAGTGTTAIGLQDGINKHLFSTQLHVVPVLKGADFLCHQIEKETNSKIAFYEDERLGAYGKASNEILDFVRDFTQKTGIMLDPIYTGKAMFILFDLIRQRSFEQGQQILFLHTGGLIGTFGMQQKFRF